MSGDADEIEALLAEADELPPCPTKLGMFEEAARLSDAVADPDLCFRVRSALIEAALELRRGDVLAVAFTWCLAAYDRDPDRYPAFDVMWAFRWAVDELVKFPDIGRDQIAGLLDDMARRYEAAGASPRAVHMLRVNVAFELGDLAAGRAALRAWSRSPRDEYTDCRSSEQRFEAEFLLEERRYARALAKAEPFITGRLNDPFDAGELLSFVLVPLVAAGRVADAVGCYRTARRLSGNSPQFIPRYSHHIRFLALTDNLAAAVALFRRHAGHAFEWVSPSERFEFCLASGTLFDRVAAAGQKRVTVRAPGFALDRPDGVFTPAELADRLRAEAAAIAARFDARNGTPLFTDWMTKQARLIRYATPYPL